MSGFNTYQTSLIEILHHLEKRGHAIALFGTRPRNALSAQIPRIKTMFIPLKYKPAFSSILFTVATSIFLPFYMAFHKLDFVMFQPDVTVLAAIPSKLLSKLAGTKFVLDIRSIPVETVGFQGLLQKIGFNISVNVAKRLFSGMTIITYPMKEEVCLNFRVNPAKVGVWTSGVATAAFNPEAHVFDGRELRNRLGLTDKFVVFYHGALSATRGIFETVDAMRIVRAKNPSILLFLLGAGSISDQLEELVKKEHLEKNVVIHNPVPYSEVPKYIAMSNVCISPLPFHPYWRFQSSLKLLEYMSMRKTTILTRIPAHIEVVGDAKCGIYISSAKPEEIAEAILLAYERRDQLDELGKTGRKIVVERYTWDKVSGDLDNYLEEVEERAR